MENVDMENPSTLAVRHPRQSVQQSSQLSLISCALTRMKAQRSHSRCHFLIITTSLWLWVQYNVISCKKEARAYTIIDHIPQYPSISKTTETWYTNTCNMPCLPPPLAWNFSTFVPWTPASIMSTKRNAGEMLTPSFLLR